MKIKTYKTAELTAREGEKIPDGGKKIITKCELKSQHFANLLWREWDYSKNISKIESTLIKEDWILREFNLIFKSKAIYVTYTKIKDSSMFMSIMDVPSATT